MEQVVSSTIYYVILQLFDYVVDGGIYKIPAGGRKLKREYGPQMGEIKTSGHHDAITYLLLSLKEYLLIRDEL